MTTQSQNVAKRATRSFLPKFVKTTQTLKFKADGAKFIGEEEHLYPSVEEQKLWSKNDYENHMLIAFNWYSNSLQEDKNINDLALSALSASGHFPDLIVGIKNSTLPIAHTSACLIRMARMGLVLRFAERRRIVKALRECLDNQKVSVESSDAKNTKPNIQEYISAKLKVVKGEIDAAFDQFIVADYRTPISSRPVMAILAKPETSAPSNRMKDLIDYATRYLSEYQLAQTGKDEQISEAYSHLGKREIKAAIAWWEQAINDFNSFGQLKKSTRKARKKKIIAPAKVVGKLKFTKTFAGLKLESFDPTQILKSSEIWTYNTRTKKLGHYVALSNSTLDVKGTRILNLDTVKSVQKTLRKPAEQLKQFNNYGKPGVIKWFNDIRAVATRLKECLNKDSILLRSVK